MVVVTGDENVIQINANGEIFDGEMVELGENEYENQERWEIADADCGWGDSILCGIGLKDLAMDFLRYKNIPFVESEITVVFDGEELEEED